MSSRDIGPALPPHMRRNHEDVGNATGERSRDTEIESRRKHRDRPREKEKERCRRDEHRDREGSSRHYADRNRDKRRAYRGEEGTSNLRPERTKSPRKNEKVQMSSSKRSKRSKTDRTYNTDTEESSDESSYDTYKCKVNNTDSSDSEQDGKEEQKSEAFLNIKTPQENENVNSLSESEGAGNLVGPALPPQFRSNGSSRAAAGSGGGSDMNICSGTEDLLFGSESCASDEEIGPALPPHLNSRVQHKREDSSSSASVGPAPPARLKKGMQENDAGNAEPETEERSCTKIIGPALPTHLKSKLECEKSEDNAAVSAIGPVLPPHLLKDETDSVGPALPPHLLKERSTEIHSDSKSSVIGPALPPGMRRSSSQNPSPTPEQDQNISSRVSDDSSDEEIVGPLLPEEMMKSGKNYIVQAQLERNAAAIKQKLEGKDLPGAGVQSREEWMTELPPEGTVDLGLGPRTFRARGAPEKGADRSGWTDTPADKARKEEEAKRRFELGISSTEEVKKAGISKELSTRDKSMEQAVKKHKRSKESLLDSHQKKLKKEKKKKEEAGAKQERRPFNREMDLKTNVFDDAQKKAIYKKAQLLDSRFSRGESKYL